MALLVALASHEFAENTLSDALDDGARKWVLRGGYACVLVAWLALLTQIKILSLIAALDWQGGRNGRAGHAPPEESPARIEPTDEPSAWSIVVYEFEHDGGKRRRYYVVVALLIVGLWIIAAAYGGYVASPLGIVFASTILFGQIRANKKQDIVILLITGLVGIVAMDVVTHWDPAAEAFIQAGRAVKEETDSGSRMLYDPVAWYPAIVVSFLISSFVNWTTFGDRSKSRTGG